MPLVAVVPVAQPPIPVTMYWAVLETVMRPALVPTPAPGVARSLRAQPAGALLPAAQAAVIRRVTPEATVEEYWAYVAAFVASGGTLPAVDGELMVKVTAEDVTAKRQNDDRLVETARVTVVALRIGLAVRRRTTTRPAAPIVRGLVACE